jgi:hypothetical protein
MNTTEKSYIGKGKQVKNFDMYNVTLNITKAQAHFFEHNGEKFLKLTLAKTKETDTYGRTHTAYVTPYEKKQTATSSASTVSEPKPAKKAKAKKEKIEPSFANH